MLFAAIFIAALTMVSACCHNDKCCETNCWEQCFQDPPATLRDAYRDVYQTVMGIKNLYLPCEKPHGTAYMMDSTVPNIFGLSASDLFSYQRQLAALVAMTQPVHNECNPFCYNKFFQGFAYYLHSWPCKNRCDAYRVIMGDTYFQSSTANSWITGGNILAKYCFDRPQLSGHKCMGCTENELLLGVVNSDTYTTQTSFAPCSSYSCAIIGTNPSASLSNLQAYAHPGMAYHLPANSVYREAVKSVLSCVQRQCCVGRHKEYRSVMTNPSDDESADRSERNVYDYLKTTDSTREKASLRTFTGTQDEFIKTVQSDSDTIFA